MSKRIIDIVQGLECQIAGSSNLEIGNVVHDSRLAMPGCAFVAIKGTNSDGHKYIPAVVKAGVKCIVCEDLPTQEYSGVSIIKVSDSHYALGIIASNFYDNPSLNLKLVGVTGTNGKTSIATLLHNLFTTLGYKTGLLSTVRNLIGEKEIPATHTTPDPINLNKLLAQMVYEGCEFVFMEVSSHAIHQKRIAGLEFNGGVFTNITHDHLDYHKTFEAYINAKKAFFDSLPKGSFALLNKDDRHGMVMGQNTKARIVTYSLNHFTDYKAKILESHFDGTLINFNGKEFWSKLIGKFNTSNLLAVYAVAILLEQDEQEALEHLSSLETVVGRFEYVRSENGVTAIIDYAHTPDALKNVFETINDIRQGQGQLITVIGAGGNRDKAKRPLMGAVAAAQSTKVIFTSDNPRDEEPQTIIDEMMHGVEIHLKKNVLAITNREEAIKAACMLATPGDIILVAGKGHETYQEIKGVRKHFNDKEVVLQNLMLNQINQQ